MILYVIIRPESPPEVVHMSEHIVIESVFEGKEDKQSLQLWVSDKTKVAFMGLKEDIEKVITKKLTHDAFIQGIVKSRFSILAHMSPEVDMGAMEE